MRRSFCGDLFYFVGISNRIVSWCGFLLTTTLLTSLAFRRNRSNILFQLDDTADSYKTHTNQCSNLSIRLRCVFVQSYHLRTFPGCYVHLTRRLICDYFTVDSRYCIMFLKSDAVAAENDCLSQLIKLTMH